MEQALIFCNAFPIMPGCCQGATEWAVLILVVVCYIATRHENGAVGKVINDIISKFQLPGHCLALQR